MDFQMVLAYVLNSASWFISGAACATMWRQRHAA